MLKQVVDTVKYCGKLMLEANAEIIKIKNSNPKNIVTEYDIKIQNILQNQLQKILPEASFFGEEGIQSFNKNGYCFVCDPIDGTTNFAKNLKHSAVSVALLKDSKPVLGVIYDPYLDEMFWAEKDKGAFCNGKQIWTTKTKLENSLIAFGTSPYNQSLQNQTWKLAAQSLKIAMDVRRLGSAVLDFAGLACGRYGVFWELELQPWDFAAGVLMVEEAGGIVKTLDGKPLIDFFAPTSIVALANKDCEAFFDVVKL